MTHHALYAAAVSLGYYFSALATLASEAIPHESDVGPQAMPHEIAPLAAEFEMPPLQRPQFPSKTVEIGEGELSSSPDLVTSVVQSRIDEVSTAGGGTVVVPPGRWRTGRLMLKSNVNLHLSKESVLEFSPLIEHYLPPVFTRCEGIEAMGLGGLIYARGQKCVAITGSGMLVGPKDGPVREQRKGLTDQAVDQHAKVIDRILDGRQGRHYFRPYFINFVECRDVFIEGVTLRNGPMWNIVPVYCDGVIVRGVHIDSRGVVNGDGVNIESSRNVLVEYCSTNTGDDCYAIKSGRNEDGLRVAKPSERIVIRNCYASGGFGGFTCGSETAGWIRDVQVKDCVFENVRHAVYFKTRRPRGGGGERITAERIRFRSTSHAIFFDMIGSPIYVGELGNRLPRRGLTPATPRYRDISIRHISGQSTEGEAFKIKGIPESPATNVNIANADIRSRLFVNLTDAHKITIRNSRFQPTNPTVRLLDTKQIQFEHTSIVPRGAQSFRLDAAPGDAATIRFEDCTPQAINTPE